METTTDSDESSVARDMPLCVEAARGDEHKAAPAKSALPATFRKFRELLMIKHYVNRDNEPNMVEPGLFIGSLGAATNLSALQAAGITHILCVARYLPLKFPAQFVYERLPLADVPDARLDDAIPMGVDFINRAITSGGKVLVHCFVGKSRSASIVLAYMMTHRRLSLDESLDLLKSARPQVHPNRGFLGQLQEYEDKLKQSDLTNTAN